MRKLPTGFRAVAGATLLAMTLAACGGDDAGTDTSANTDTTQSEAPADGGDMGSDMGEATAPADPFAALKVAAGDVGNNGSAAALSAGLDAALGLDGDVTSTAATVRAELSTLLQEHVFLAGIAVDAAFSFGLESGEFGLAAETLDTNSVELADLVGSVVPDQRDAFLGLWREHIGFFVDYAVGAASGDQAAKDAALASLDGYRQQAGSFFESITGGALPADAVADNLTGHINTLAAAIDAFAAGDANGFDLLREAAAHVRMSGAVLSGGIAAAAGFDGDVNSPASETLSTVSLLLEEHVYLAGIAVKKAYEAGGNLEDPTFTAAATALDGNSTDLADLIGSVAPDQRDAFLGLWREHIGFFVEYAVAAAGSDADGIQAAKDKLAGYGDQAGSFFESISGGAIPADAVKGSLEQHVKSLGDAIESLANAMLGASN